MRSRACTSEYVLQKTIVENFGALLDQKLRDLRHDKTCYKDLYHLMKDRYQRLEEIICREACTRGTAEPNMYFWNWTSLRARGVAGARRGASAAPLRSDRSAGRQVPEVPPGKELPVPSHGDHREGVRWAESGSGALQGS